VSRLGELLARNLGISKTAAARLIDEGRVRDAAGVPYPDRKAVIPDASTVFVDGDAVSLWSAALVMLHKPVGVVTALHDHVHPTAYDLLREAPLFPELRAAGRLDLETSGLLLWTTEGALIQRLTHPKRRVPRTYQAALARPFAPPPSELVLDDGHRPELLELRPLGPTEVHPALIIPADSGPLATVTIVGGAYHEVRRLFAALGTHVVGLCRTRFGAYELPVDLPPGGWRALPFPSGSGGSL
jgi:16S rRNA pseudouridine516 synthase